MGGKTKNANSINEQRQQQESVPRRRETIVNMPRVGSSNCISASFHTTAAPRRVSWSDRYSVSFFDGGKSPARCCATGSSEVAQFLPSKDGKVALESIAPVFPPLPFTSPCHGNKTRATMKPVDTTSISSNSSVMKLHVDKLSTADDTSNFRVHLETISSFTSADDDSTSALPTTKILGGYSLGDAPKSNNHMIIPTTREEGIKYASTLQPLDFVFVLCNDGQWTYSIVCDITEGNKDLSVEQEPRMRFVLDRYGSTKSIPRKNWGHKIRLLTNDVDHRPLLLQSRLPTH
jgi:hypothetical protein